MENLFIEVFMEDSMKCISEYYTYQSRWHEPYQEFVGTCVEMPLLSFLAETHAKAIVGIRDLVKQVVEGMIEAGEEPPALLSDRNV
jgi:hypothetical protein